MKPGKIEDILEELKSVRGKWTLTPNHELRYHSRQKDETIKFKGSVFSAKPDALAVAYELEQVDQKVVNGILELSGTWRLDSKNRILFEMERESGKKDAIVFRGAWSVNDSNQIIYSYTETQLKTKKKVEKELVFKGYWDISDGNRLTYYVGGDTGNAFRFRGAFQTKSVLAKKGELRYQAGVEINGKNKIQTIILFGKWIVSDDWSVSFEIEYGRDGKRAIVFGGRYRIGKSEISLNLKNNQGKPAGIELIFTRDFFKDAQGFLRFQKTIEESRVEAGMSAQF